ncbi:hypothetical protein HPB49_003531 [Dermacentor silvarum]|uniref:Uncharacterized protein n=1 Tax=Dermacentor silvarum TaxID=543639 RepID=A0ACB8CDB7_DERSI|nr:hypothetical protein HPB49_003531 [Dermacentor silvarum]
MSTCRTCGVRNPEVTHNCTPTCAICSGDHVTGDRSCPKRLKPVRYQAAKPPKKPHKPAHRWFSSEDEQSEWEYGRGLTRSSRSRTRSPSNNRTDPGQPEQQRRRNLWSRQTTDITPRDDASTSATATDPVVVNIKLPKFWQTDSELWVLSIEPLFRQHRVTSPAAMYDHVIGALRLPSSLSSGIFYAPRLLQSRTML